ncbi:hypothetical protein L1887_63079 [Cichorium endivia]|nr:hypothetical protein L1887_63079 [Cichorium endivia]
MMACVSRSISARRGSRALNAYVRRPRCGVWTALGRLPHDALLHLVHPAMLGLVEAAPECCCCLGAVQRLSVELKEGKRGRLNGIGRERVREKQDSASAGRLSDTRAAERSYVSAACVPAGKRKKRCSANWQAERTSGTWDPLAMRRFFSLRAYSLADDSPEK